MVSVLAGAGALLNLPTRPWWSDGREGWTLADAETDASSTGEPGEPTVVTMVRRLPEINAEKTAGDTGGVPDFLTGSGLRDTQDRIDLLSHKAHDPKEYFAMLRKMPHKLVQYFLSRGAIHEAVVAAGAAPVEFFRSVRIDDPIAVAGNLGRSYARATRGERSNWFNAVDGLSPDLAAAYQAAFAGTWFDADPVGALEFLSGQIDWKDPTNSELRRVLLDRISRWKDGELLAEWKSFTGG
jgi:hypothetical protein